MNDEHRVREVLARYVRALDRRDGKTQGALYTDDAIVQSFTKTGPDSYEPVTPPMIGGAAVAYAVDNYVAPHPEGGSSHHVTADPVVEVDGDTAHLNAQFIVFKIQSHPRPADGWPSDAFGAQATLTPIESGYYDLGLRRTGDEWKIIRHDVLLDMPYVIPGV